MFRPFLEGLPQEMYINICTESFIKLLYKY